MTQVVDVNRKDCMSQYASSLSGEYFVAAELLRRGYNTSIVVGNAKAVDVLVSNEANTKTVLIQVKTTVKGHNKSGKIYWMLNRKAEQSQENLFYVLVYLRGNTDRPLYYIVHSSVVADMSDREIYSTIRVQSLMVHPEKKLEFACSTFLTIPT